jgi:phosphonopyruvate decarboxylase
MNLGCLTLAAETDRSLIHVVLDNRMHQSTGGQKSLLPTDLTAVARGAGYPIVLSVRTEDDLAALDTIRGHRRPLFIHATVAPRQSGASRRVRQTPQELIARVGAFLEMS